jgi:hypothetical protein
LRLGNTHHLVFAKFLFTRSQKGSKEGKVRPVTITILAQTILYSSDVNIQELTSPQLLRLAKDLSV